MLYMMFFLLCPFVLEQGGVIWQVVARDAYPDGLCPEIRSPRTQVKAGINSLIVSDNAAQWGFRGRERRAYITQNCSTQPFQYSLYPWLIRHRIVEQLQASWSKEDVYHVDTSVQILTLPLCRSSTRVLSLSLFSVDGFVRRRSHVHVCVCKKILLSKWNIKVKKKKHLCSYDRQIKILLQLCYVTPTCAKYFFQMFARWFVHILESSIGLHLLVCNHNKNRHNDMFIPVH